MSINTHLIRLFTASMSAATLFIWCAVAHAGTGLEISDPWVRFAPPNAKVHAAYMSIKNGASDPRILVSVESPSYDRVEIHLSKVVDGTATMEKLDELAIAPGQEVILEPGSYHLMMFGPKDAQKLDAAVPLTLKLKNGGQIKFEATVRNLEVIKVPRGSH